MPPVTPSPRLCRSPVLPTLSSQPQALTPILLTQHLSEHSAVRNVFLLQHFMNVFDHRLTLLPLSPIERTAAPQRSRPELRSRLLRIRFPCRLRRRWRRQRWRSSNLRRCGRPPPARRRGQPVDGLLLLPECKMRISLKALEDGERRRGMGREWTGECGCVGGSDAIQMRYAAFVGISLVCNYRFHFGFILVL